MQLTRRGRAVLAVLVVVLMIAAVALVRAPATASTPTVAARSGAVAERVTVRPGQTLWQISLTVAPNADPRATIARIKDMNGLETSAIEAGRVLLVPATRAG